MEAPQDGRRVRDHIIDAKEPKRIRIYKRFADEAVKKGGYEYIGGQRKFKSGEDFEATVGFILKDKKI